MLGGLLIIMFRPFHLTLGALFICLMAIGANITVWFPFLSLTIGGTTVPISLQTFFAIICGFLLDRKLSILTMLSYLFIGLIGIPVFAGLKAGPMVLLLPTGGFLLSFVIVAYVISHLRGNFPTMNLLTYFYIALIGLLINYSIGITFMYFSMKFIVQTSISYSIVITSMVPFFIKDLLLTSAAAIFLKRIEPIYGEKMGVATRK